jgi:hypothetical protein
MSEVSDDGSDGEVLRGGVLMVVLMMILMVKF